MARHARNNAIVNVRDFGAIGDGSSDDTAAFQAAAARAAGGRLLIPTAPVSWKLSDAITLVAGTDVQGTGRAGLVKQTADETPIFVTTADNIRLWNVALYGKGEFSNAWVSDSHDGIGLKATGSSGVQVIGCEFLNFALAGVWASAVENLVVADSTVVGTNAYGGTVNTGAAHQYGIAVVGAFARARIIGNDVSDTAFGIDCSTGSDVVVQGNIVHDIPGQHGIYFGASKASVSGNIVRDFASVGIKVYYGAVGTQTDVAVSGNTIYSATADNAGILAAAAATGTLKNVSITGNTIRNTSGTPTTTGLPRGVYVSAARGVVVSGNSIHDTKQAGVMVGADDAVTDCLVTGNQIDTDGTNGILVSGAVTRLRITNNTLDGVGNTADIGINVTGACSDVTIRGNDVAGWYYSMDAANATAVRVYGNSFTGYAAEPMPGTTDVAVYDGNHDGKEVTTYTTSSTLSWYDRNVRGSASGGAITLTLRTAAGCRGKRVTIKKVDASGNAVTVDGNGAETIDGALTYSLATQYKSVTLESDGSNWLVTGFV